MSILVSINCITYNHELYIADALQGFLNQKTNFDFEILIGEDCSTDGTREIVEKFMRLNPGIIRLITSDMNVGFMKNIRRLHENSKGKYIAVCEGDDYWIDPYKLQKQVDYMENHPECTLCFHNAKVIKDKQNSKINLMLDYQTESRKYTAGELAVLGFIPTASKLFRKYTMDNPPEWYLNSIVGDYPEQLIVSSYGYAYYINEVMSIYRTGVKGSATDRLLNSKNVIEKKLKLLKGIITILNNFDRLTNYGYRENIDEARMIREFEILMLEKKMSEIKSPRYKSYLDKLKSNGIAKFYSRYYFPKAYIKLANIKEYIRELKDKSR